MEIRTATMDDLQAVAAVEADCFPAAEAATEAEFAERLRYYGNHFWLTSHCHPQRCQTAFLTFLR